MKLQNSFLDSKINNLSVMVIVPHQDDEINLSGSILAYLAKKNVDLKIVYSTNGDSTFKASTRQKECKEALALLGIHERDIIFLGYGDSLVVDYRNLSDNEVVKTPAGYTETYGQDYAFIKNKKHNAYTKMNYFNDLENVIVDYKPDVIFAIDYDIHPDHRMLSLAFDEVMGKILKEYKAYTPLVYKGFAYATAFNAPKDFHAVNLIETIKPRNGVVQHYYEEYDLIDKSLYQWDARTRFPVIEECRESNIFSNILFKALAKHKSQAAGLKAKRVINSDSVFWERRTDSISYTARIEVSSNEELARNINDFMVVNSADIFTVEPKFDKYLWYPDELDHEKSFQMSWDSSQQIKLIRVYGNVNDGSYIEKLEVEIAGKKYSMGPFDKSGKAIELSLPETVFTDKINFRILEYEGVPGIAECEIYSEKSLRRVLPPVVKGLIYDNFAYEYYIDKNIKELPIGTYVNGIDKSESVSIECTGESYVEKNILKISPRDKRIKIKFYVVVDGKEHFDEVLVIRVNKIQMKCKKLSRKLDYGLSGFILKLQRRMFKKKAKKYGY